MENIEENALQAFQQREFEKLNIFKHTQTKCQFIACIIAKGLTAKYSVKNKRFVELSYFVDGDPHSIPVRGIYNIGACHNLKSMA